jgi:hypothetical protein
LVAFLARPANRRRYSVAASEWDAVARPASPPAFANEPAPHFDRKSLRVSPELEQAAAIYRSAGWN